MNLPPLNALGTQSFWANIISAIAMMNAAFQFIPVFDVEATTAAVSTLIGLISQAYGYFQRANPTRRVTLTGPMK